MEKSKNFGISYGSTKSLKLKDHLFLFCSLWFDLLDGAVQKVGIVPWNSSDVIELMHASLWERGCGVRLAGVRYTDNHTWGLLPGT